MTNTEARITLGLREDEKTTESGLEAVKEHLEWEYTRSNTVEKRQIRKEMEAVNTLLHFGREYGKW